LEFSINEQLKTITEIEQRIYDLLDSKLESFDFLLQLANQDEIDVYLINGSIVIEKNEALAQLEDQVTSLDDKLHQKNGIKHLAT
jgi:coenzyme F420-reducing hydrogenase gamma subunit